MLGMIGWDGIYMWWWITAPACTSQMFFSWSRAGHPKTQKAQHRTILCRDRPGFAGVFAPGPWLESMGIHGNLWSMFNDVWWIRNRIMMSKMFKLLVGWWFVVGFMRLFDHPNWVSYFSEGFKPPTSNPLLETVPQVHVRGPTWNSMQFHDRFGECRF